MEFHIILYRLIAHSMLYVSSFDSKVIWWSVCR